MVYHNQRWLYHNHIKNKSWNTQVLVRLLVCLFQLPKPPFIEKEGKIQQNQQLSNQNHGVCGTLVCSAILKRMNFSSRLCPVSRNTGGQKIRWCCSPRTLRTPSCRRWRQWLSIFDLTEAFDKIWMEVFSSTSFARKSAARRTLESRATFPGDQRQSNLKGRPVLSWRSRTEFHTAGSSHPPSLLLLSMTSLTSCATTFHRLCTQAT